MGAVFIADRPSSRFNRFSRPGVWEAQYRRYCADGRVEKPREFLGDETQFKNKTDVKNSDKYRAFVNRINEVRVVAFYKDLCRLFREKEIPKRVPKGQATESGFLNYLEDQWGEHRLDQLILKKYDINNWLQGDLPLRSEPDRQASRQTRKHLRRILVSTLTFAVDNHFLPFNPFVGTALTVKKGGAMPVDRSRFFIREEWFRFLLADPELPGHVKMMLQLAYFLGMSQSEFLGLRWEDIDFDGPEPQINIQRSVDGADVNEFGKVEARIAPVPMCDRIGAALLIYKDQFPSVSGWVFGSMRTKRPFWGTQLQADYLRPALLRMAVRFKLKGIPEGTGFHAFRHAYNVLVEKRTLEYGTLTAKDVKAVQMELMRHADAATNERYGKNAPPRRERARQVQEDVVEQVMCGVN